MSNCANISCRGKNEGLEVACSRGCVYKVCLTCWNTPNLKLPKQCSSCGTASTGWTKRENETSKKFTSLHHDPFVAALMARGVIGNKAGVPISGLTDSLTRDPSFVDFYQKEGQNWGWTDEEWSFVADHDFQSGYYTPGYESRKTESIWKPQPIFMDPVVGTPSPSVNPPAPNMFSLVDLGDINADYATNWFVPEGTVDLNLYPHAFVSSGADGMKFFDKSRKQVATPQFQKVSSIAFHPELGVYALLSNAYGEGPKIRLVMATDPTEVAAEIDLAACSRFPGFSVYEVGNLNFIPKASSDLLALVDREKQDSGPDQNTVSIFDVNAGEIVQHLAFWTADLEYNSRRLTPSSSLHVVPDPIRPSVLYAAGEAGFAYYDLRVNTKRPIRFVRTGHDRLYEFKVPDYGSVNTMLSLIEDRLCFYDITMAKLINFVGVEDGSKSVTYYGKQVAVSSMDRTDFYSLDGATYKPYLTLKDYGRPEMYQLKTYWNNAGFHRFNYNEHTFAPNVPTATPFVDGAAGVGGPPKPVAKGLGLRK